MSGTPTARNPEYTYQTILEPVQVPRDCYPIEVAQFYVGEYSPGFPRPFHWVILVYTTAKSGNLHELFGDSYTYVPQNHFNVRLPLHEREDWRGGHVIGYVSPSRLEDLLDHIAYVPVRRHQVSWNSQNWVYDVLKGLNCRGLYTDENMTFQALQAQMALEAWQLEDL